MENNNTHNKHRSVSENNKRSRDRSKRYSMFYESTDNSNEMTDNSSAADNHMVKSSSLSDIDNNNKKDKSLSLRHAKNLRSSLFMNKDNEMVKYMNEKVAEKEHRKANHRVENDKENNFFSSDDDDNNNDENPNEIKTMNIQFSNSPSLSALAGYLQTKDQKTSENTSVSTKKDHNVSLLNRKPYNTPMENIFENEEYEPHKKSEGVQNVENKPRTNDITASKQQKPNLQTLNVKKNTLPINRQQIVRKVSEDKSNKKSSIFSIFRKKSVNRSTSDSKYLPVSETFSNKSASKKNSMKDFKGRTPSMDLRQGSNPKVPSRENLPKISNKNDNAPVQRRDVGSMHNNKKISVSNSENSNMTAKSSPKILGEDVFPKHLDITEISSIHTLEKAKRASLTLTPNNKRMSLPDSISIKQENEGMFVEYDSNLHIHTPDLSKSPTSSILRSGRFDNGTNRNSIILSDSGLSTNRNSLILSDSGRRSNRNSRYENRNSLLSNSNTNGINNSSQTKLILEEDKKDGPLLDIDFDFEDSEYVSEIMEFKNIIDFGDYINLDFNESSVGDAGFKEDAPPIKDNLVLNGLGILPTNEKNDVAINENSEVVNRKTLAPPLNTDIAKVETKYSPSSDDPYLPAIDPESPDTPRKMRPLSMSFKGLDLKNNYDNIFEVNEEDLEQPLVADDLDGLDEGSQEEAEEESFAEDEDFNFYESDEDAYLDEIHDYVEQNFPTRITGTSQYGDIHNTKSQKKSVSFASKIILYDTFAAEEYDRRPELATCNQLTPELAMFIREEVNNMKSEMEFHEDSIQYIHFL